MLKELIYNIGDEDWLKSDSIFCFGDRQTFKTTNMLLKPLLKFLENPKDNFTVLLVSGNSYYGSAYLSRMEELLEILETFSIIHKINIKRRTRSELLFSIDNKNIIYRVCTTDTSCRGVSSNFQIFDEPEFYPNKKNLIRGALISGIHNDSDFVIGGHSYYSK